LYTSYLLLSFVFLLRKGLNPAVVALLPQLLYVPAFFIIYFCLFRAVLGGSNFKYYLGAGLAIIVFFLALGISATIGGADLGVAWSGLVGGGSFYGFNRVFTRAIFISSGFQSALSSEQFTEYSTSIKNELSSCVVVLYAIMRSLRDFRSTLWSRVFESACFGIVAIVVVLSFSRSAFLGFGLALSVSFAVSILSSRSPIDRTFLAALGFLIAVAAIAVLSNVGPVLLSSFEDSTSYEERLEQFNTAVHIIDANIWSGTGTNVDIGGHDIHNLFLATWAKSGFFPFLAVLLAYLLLLGTWLGTLVKTITVRNFWRLAGDPGWVFAIPIVPLLRVYLSGKGGTFSVSMWLGTAAFLAFIVANRAAILQAFGAEGDRLESNGEHS
ncbi:MAG: O-antigen ligase family protein, partial [Hypericibacter sp.]